MSIPIIVILSVCYVVPLAFAALLLVRSDCCSRRLMLGILLALPLFYATHYLLLKALQGWPSDTPLPPSFNLVGSHVTEPAPYRDEDGEILLWVTTPGDAQPRVYRLAYDRALHEALDDAGRMMADGESVVGEQRPEEHNRGDDRTGIGARPDIVFEREPPQQLPNKASLND